MTERNRQDGDPPEPHIHLEREYLYAMSLHVQGYRVWRQLSFWRVDHPHRGAPRPRSGSGESLEREGEGGQTGGSGMPG